MDGSLVLLWGPSSLYKRRVSLLFLSFSLHSTDEIKAHFSRSQRYKRGWNKGLLPVSYVYRPAFNVRDGISYGKS